MSSEEKLRWILLPIRIGNGSATEKHPYSRTKLEIYRVFCDLCVFAARLWSSLPYNKGKELNLKRNKKTYRRKIKFEREQILSLSPEKKITTYLGVFITIIDTKPTLVYKQSFIYLQYTTDITGKMIGHKETKTAVEKKIFKTLKLKESRSTIFFIYRNVS